VASLSISVAMTTFNGATHLGEQLADLAAQTRLPAELVVCDDGSTDDTLTILERFAASAPFSVHIHRNSERLGYRANFLKCASLCQSDLVAFCDQDDRWVPSKLATMVACFDDADVLLAFHDADIIGEDERPLGSLPQRGLPVGKSRRLTGSPWAFSLGFSQLFRRWLCELDQWWPLSRDHLAAEPLAHDQWYFFLAWTLGTIEHVEEPLVRYRQHQGNVYGWSKRSWSLRLLERFRSSSQSVARRADAAMRRATILDAAAATLPPPYRQRAVEGALFYQRIADVSGLRAAMHRRPTFMDRVRGFAAFVRAGGYGAHVWQFGTDAMALDLFVAIPFGAGSGKVGDEALGASPRGRRPR
jgi:Glycosyl transferase family 2